MRPETQTFILFGCNIFVGARTQWSGVLAGSGFVRCCTQISLAMKPVARQQPFKLLLNLRDGTGGPHSEKQLNGSIAINPSRRCATDLLRIEA